MSEFWVEKPSSIFSSWNLVPSKEMSLEERMNTLTRLLIVVCIVLLILKETRTAKILLIAGLIAIIFIYYSFPDQEEQQESYIVTSSNSDIPENNFEPEERTTLFYSARAKLGKKNYSEKRKESIFD